MQLADAFLNNAFQCPAPARMEYSDGAAFCVEKNYRQAIGSENREQDAGNSRDQAVASENRFRDFVNAMNQVRVDLTYRDEGPIASLAHGSEVAQKSRPILFDCGAGVVLGKAQIQGAPAVNLGEPTGPGAEAMNEAGNRLERIGLQDFAFSLAGSLERHRNILAMSSPSGTRTLQQIVGVMFKLAAEPFRRARPASAYNSALRSFKVIKSDKLQEPHSCVSLL